MARIAPAEYRTEMFGLFAFSGRATAYFGPFVLGTLTYVFDSQRRYVDHCRLSLRRSDYPSLKVRGVTLLL